MIEALLTLIAGFSIYFIGYNIGGNIGYRDGYTDCKYINDPKNYSIKRIS